MKRGAIHLLESAIALTMVWCLFACQGEKNANQGTSDNTVNAFVEDENIISIPNSEDRTIVFTPQWTPQAQFAGYYAAKELGLYEIYGLNVRIEHPTTTYSAMERMRDNVSNATTLQLVQAMEIIDNGIPLVNILQTSMNAGTAFVSKKGTTPLHLQGGRVGLWAAGFDQLPLAVNVKEELGYEWVRIASNVNLFVSGDLDAITVMTYNEYYQLLQAGLELTEENVYRFCDSDYNIPEDGVYMTRDFYQKNPNVAKAFAAATKMGWEWAAANPEKALDMVMKYVDEGHVSTNRTMQRLMLQEIIRLQKDKETGEQAFLLKEEMVKKASDLMYSNGLISSKLSYQDIMP
ncbi:MAG: ABC transporter substrate-binding protein [Bacteroidaceae bacterium]|nr:ABC transporter substrate-binding protein [Bacteroidaceae bacterium]